MTSFIRLSLLAAFALALRAGGASAELTVESANWGFDGKVIINEYNLLTVVVSNPGIEPVEEMVSLFGGGTKLPMECALAPGGRRVLQFFPFVDFRQNPDDWSLRWRGHSEPMPQATESAGAVVHLVGVNALTEDRSTFLTPYPAAQFPIPPVASRTLATVILNHSPDWGAPGRAEAFLAWLEAGGRLFIYQNAEGEMPVFGAPLEMLNALESSFPVGRGRVLRQTTRVSAITRQDAMGFEDAVKPKETNRYRQTPSWMRDLNGLTRPDTPWGLIGALAFAYLILVGPVHYRYSRNRPRIRGSLLIFAALVGGFSLILGFIGQQGFGQPSQMYSVAIAKQLEPGRFEVDQWSHIFTRRSGERHLRYEGGSSLYHLPSEQFNLNSGDYILNGRDGFASFEMPIFSSRAAQWRGIVDGPNVTAVFEDGTRFVPPYSVSVRVEGLSESPEAVFLVIDEVMFTLAYENGLWVQSLSPDYMDDLLEEVRRPTYGYYGANDYNESRVFKALATKLATWHCAYGESAPDRRPRVELMVYAKVPESMRPAEPVLDRSLGYVIYAIDVSEADKKVEPNP